MQAFSIADGDTITDQNAPANNVPGMLLSVRTDLGTSVRAWRAAPTVSTPDQCYFCHGYSLGTYAPFRYSVSGTSMPAVLADEYQKIGGIGDAQNVGAGDILVWWQGNDASHSAVVRTPAYKAGGELDPAASVIGSKNGTGPVWTGALLNDISSFYQTAPLLEVYRRHA